MSSDHKPLGAHVHHFSDDGVLVNPWQPGLDHPITLSDAYRLFNRVVVDG